MSEAREYAVGKVRKLIGKTRRAVLGRGDSAHTVLVAGKANYVYIRVKYGSELGIPVEALNRHVPPIHGRVVRVKEIDRAGIKGYEIIDFDDAGVPYYHDTTEQVVIPAHGHTHESSQDAMGTDPVNLYARGWAALRVEPTDPCSMYGYVTRGWYMCEVPAWFVGGNTPIFTAPPAGQRYDLVYIDCSGTIGIEQGVAGPPGFIDVPEPPDFTIPLAAIYMTGTTGCIIEDTILDCRVMPNLKMPAGGARFDDSITPSAVQAGVGSWAGAQEYPSRADHRHNLVKLFGSCYGNHIDWSQAAAAQNTWYNISDADMADGMLHGITHDGNGQLTVTEPGKYLITYSICYEDTIANDHVEAGIEIGGSGAAQAAGRAHSENKFANEEEHLSSCAIFDLVDNATVELAIRTTDAGTPTITVDGINITVVMVG